MSAQGRRGRDALRSTVRASSEAMARRLAPPATPPAGVCYSSRVESGLLPRFFERVTRQTFRDLALDDPPVMRYLVDLLTRFARTEALYVIRDLPGRRLESVADSLLEIQRVWQWESPDFKPEAEPALRRHVGDYTLFMTGIFREHVERLSVTGYYQHEGRRAYRFVSETERAGGRPDAPLYRRLSDSFEHYAGALSYARKVYFGSEQWPPGTRPDDPFFRALAAE